MPAAYVSNGITTKAAYSPNWPRTKASSCPTA